MLSNYISRSTTRRRFVFAGLHRAVCDFGHHVCGEHKECAQLKYFCDGKNKENERNIVPELMKIGVYQDVK